MQQYSTISSFESLPIEIFWYPAKESTSVTVLLLKGLYGWHSPEKNNSWDTELIEVCGDKYNFISINTARKGATIEERSSKEAFIGKTFEQECDDIREAYKYLKENNILPDPCILIVIGNSFGGTSLLGVPEVIHEAGGIIMIGSGCGKSPTTTKPLLATLFEEEKLLDQLRFYKGVFAFVRGADDTVVPRESQEKIIKNTDSVSMRVSYVIAGANHDLSPSADAIIDRPKILSSIVNHIRAWI